MNDVCMNDVCPKCRKPLKPGVIRPHPTRADLAVHSFECANCGAGESRGHNGLIAVMPAAGKHKSAARPSPHRKEAQWRPVSVAALTIFATDRFVGSVELSLLSTVDSE